MSASTVLAHDPRLAQHLGYAVGQPPLMPAPIGDTQPQPGDIGELCLQFAAVCESAVDSLEISSALEFEGWSDDAVRKRYGLPDVFALADELYQRVRRQPAEPEELPDPWPASTLRPVLHGLLYGLPTIWFPAAAGLLAGPSVLSALSAGLLASWALSQGLAYLGYLRRGQADEAQAARLLRAGLAVGTAGVVLTLAVAYLVLPVRVPALIFCAGLGMYMLGGSVLMVLGGERLLLAAASPGVLGAAVFLAVGKPPPLEPVAWGMLAATPLLALILATARTTLGAGFGRGPGRQSRAGTAAGPLLTAAELRGALPSASFGLVAAGLLVFPVTQVHGGAATGALYVSLPLALSMGGAEWALVEFRRRTQRQLRSTRLLAAFAARARAALLTALLQYLACAVVLTVAVTAVAGLTGLMHLQVAALPQIAAYLVLGGAMFVALLLQAFGSGIVPPAACAVALAAEIACRRWGVTGQLVIITALLIALTGYAATVLGSAIRHLC
jgi:hypothetical protein